MFDCVLFLKWFSEFCELMFCKSLILEFNINLFNGKSMILLSLRLNFIKCIVQAIIEIKHVINQTFLFSIEDTQGKGINMTANLVFFSV